MNIQEPRSLRDVELKDIEVGKPLPYALYDGIGSLLLRRGDTLESLQERETLIRKGLFRIPDQGSLTQTQRVAEEPPRKPRGSNVKLEATKIRIGDPLQLQSVADSRRISVRLIGFLKNKGLIVTVPESDGELILLKDGMSFTVRFFSGKNAYAFSSMVVRQTSMPFPHVHLSYPRELRSVEVRRGARIEVDLIAAIDGHESEEFAGKIVNLSTGGAALRSKAPLGGTGDVITVKFKTQIHDLQSLIVLQSKICSISDDQGDPDMPCVHGLQFLEPDQGAALALMAFVYQRLVDDTL